MMKKRQEKEINPQYNQFSQQGRFGSELDWDLESEFESASQDLEQSDSVVSALPNPEWNRDDCNIWHARCCKRNFSLFGAGSSH